MDAKEVIKRADAARGQRNRLEPMFDDAMRLTMPGRPRFHFTGVERGDEIFDETGANGVSEFVSRMQGGLVPAFSEFMRLEASENVDPKDRKAVNDDLAEITKFVFENVWESNFSQEVSESFHDLAISTGVLCFEEGDHGKAFHHRAIPITEVDLERGHDDMVGGVFRRSKVKAGHLQARYPQMEDGSTALKSMMQREADKELEVVEYSRSIPGREPSFEHVVVIKDLSEVIVSRTLTGEGSNPFIAFRWQTTAGETWGRGPLLNALAAIRTTNLMVEMVLENAAMAIVGLYQTDNDGTMNADQISLLPGTILAKEIGTRGLEPIQGPSGDFNMRDLVMNDQRINIKRALFNDMLSDPNKTPATATEVAERMADLANRTAGGFSRLFYEFLQPYMRRALYILERRGDIELPVKNGRAIKFRAVSPLAQAQNGRDLQAMMQHHQIMAGLYGPQIGGMAYETERLIPWINEKLGVDTRLIKEPKAIMQAIEEMAQQMAQMQGAAQ